MTQSSSDELRAARAAETARLFEAAAASMDAMPDPIADIDAWLRDSGYL